MNGVQSIYIYVGTRLGEEIWLILGYLWLCSYYLVVVYKYSLWTGREEEPVMKPSLIFSVSRIQPLRTFRGKMVLAETNL